MKSGEKPLPGDILVSNSALHFASTLLYDPPDAKGYGLASLFDLAKILESLVLNEKLWTLPSYSVSTSKLATELRKEGLLAVLDVDSNFELVVSRAKCFAIDESEARDLSMILARLFGVDQEYMLKIIRKVPDWAIHRLNTPDWENLRSWFYHPTNEEISALDFHDPTFAGVIRLQMAHEDMFDVNTLQEVVARLLVRTWMYLDTSSVNNLSYSVDTVRIPIVEYYNERAGLKLKALRESVVSRVVKAYTAELEKQLNDAVGWLGTKYTINMPLTLCRVISESKSKEDILEKAIEIRETDKAVRFRKWLAGLELAYRNLDVNKLTEARREFEGSFVGTTTDQLIMAFMPQVSIDVTGTSFSWGPSQLLDLVLRYYRSRRFQLLHDMDRRVAAILECRHKIRDLFGFESIDKLAWTIT